MNKTGTVWIATAPTGVVSTGPAVIYDWDVDLGQYDPWLTVQEYIKMGWTVEQYIFQADVVKEEDNGDSSD